MSRRILIVGPSWVGDMVMAQALFISLQRDAQAAGTTLAIDVLAPAWSRPLLVRMPEVRRAIDLPFQHGELNLRGRYRLGHSLRKEGYEQVIVLPNSFKSALLTLFVRSGRRTGWRGESRGLLLNDVRDLDEKALAADGAALRGTGAGCRSRAARAAAAPAPGDAAGSTCRRRSSALGLGRERPVLVICPGAEFGDAKQWPAQHYASVCTDRIAAGWQVWILGSAKDGVVATQIRNALPADAQAFCQDLTGRTSLAQAIDVMSVATAVRQQ
jgi:heptosyltransferase-2